MKILVITSCTAKKKYEYTDKTICPAIEMYQGAQHLLIKEGYLNYLKFYDNLDMIIISAGYGVIKPDTPIHSYNTSFNDMNETEIKNHSINLHITEDLNKILPEYDIIFLCLGLNYLKSIDFSKLDISQNQKFFIFSSFDNYKQLTYLRSYHIINSGKQEAIDYSYGIIGLKGYLFKLLCNEFIKDKDLLNSLYRNPELIDDILEKYKGVRKNYQNPLGYKKIELF